MSKACMAANGMDSVATTLRGQHFTEQMDNSLTHTAKTRQRNRIFFNGLVQGCPNYGPRCLIMRRSAYN